MPDNRFRPTAPDFGTMISHTPFGTPGTLTCTANQTTNFVCPTPNGAQSNAQSRLKTASVIADTVATDADGSITCTLIKYVSGTADTTLTTALNFTGLTSKVGSRFTLASGLTEPGRRFNQGDVLVASFISNSAAIDTQAVGVWLTPEWEVIKP